MKITELKLVIEDLLYIEHVKLIPKVVALLSGSGSDRSSFIRDMGSNVK